MAQIFPCVGLLLIIIVLAVIFLRKNFISKKVNSFYQQNHFADVTTIPENINELFDHEILNPKHGEIVVQNQRIPLYWIESCTYQIPHIIKTPRPKNLHYLTVVFPPASVSHTFIQQTINSVNPHPGFINWDTETVVQATVLADGSFAIKWQNFETTENYEKKMAWLMANVH